MSLHPPCHTTTMLESLDAAGIAIVLEGEDWYIKYYQQLAGPYDSAEAALEASSRWLAATDAREVAGTPVKPE